MSNDFYNLETPIPAREIARAERVNSEFEAVAAGFDKLLPSSAILARTGMWATASGGPNNYVLTVTKPPTAYTAGMQIAFRATGANTTGVSVNVNGLGAKAVVNNATGGALAAGELAGASGTVIVIVYDGLAAFRLISAGAPIDSSPGETTSLYDLVDDGTTDQADELEALIVAYAASGTPLDLVGQADGSSELLIDRRIVLDAMPPSMSVSRIALKFNAANSAGIYIRGQEVELPETGKAKLYVDVDVSGGAVTAFDISVSANPSIVDLLVAGAIVIIRGQNGSDGDVLDGHKHEDTVVSCVQVSGTRYTLTLTNGLPAIDGDVWYREWEDSEHSVSPDYTLISVLAIAYATADMTDSRTMTIASGQAAALGLATGSWVEVIDDATGSDTHGTSTELLNRQTVRIAAVTAGSPDTITFDEPVRGTFTTANRARLVVLTTCPEFMLKGPGPAFPIRVVGTPPASPASRRHLIEVKYAISPELTGWFYEYVAADGSTRGAPIRDSNCYEPWVHHNGVVGPWSDFAGAFTGGDYYCAWSKGSTRPLYEHNTFLGGRHCLVMANAKGGVARFNRLGYSGFQCLDFHGENEIDVEAYGNVIVRGPAWVDRDRHVAIQLGNQTHTFGVRGGLVIGNTIIGFDDDDDVGVLVVSGCQGITVDQRFKHPVGEAVRVEADRRAPTVAISSILIVGEITNATTGAVVDGRMPTWETETQFEGTSTRPTYCETSEGAVWSTTETGESGPDEPEIGMSPVVDTTTWDDGGITWTLRSLTKYSPITGIAIKGAVIDGAATPIIARRLATLNLQDCKITADEGVRLLDCPAFRAQNLQARIGGSGNSDWLIDEGGNTGEYRVVDANGGGVTDGGSTITDATPAGGGGSGTLTGHVTAIIPITEAGDLTTAMKWATVLDANARHNTVQIALGSSGTVNLPADALEGDEFRLDCVGGSEAITLAVVGGNGTIAGESSVTPAIPSIGIARCVYVNPGTSARTYEYEGPLVGVTSYAHGSIEAVEPSGSDQRSTLSGFNSVVLDADEETASFNFDASHAGKVVPANHAATPITATIPSNASVPYPIGTVLSFLQVGAAAVTLAISTDTLRTPPGRTLVAAGQWAHVGARKRAATEWVAFGDLTAS